jgi:hypothetical protein
MYKLNKNTFGIAVLPLLCVLFFYACSSSPASPPAQRTALSGNASSEKQPEWVNKPDTKYPQAQYVAASGDGKTAEEAQYKARVNLLGIFGMKISDDLVIDERYIETNKSGNTSWSDSLSSERRISASAEGILAGCEIKENWKNSKGTEYYALAVMERTKTVDLYKDIISRLSRSINETLNVQNKNTFEGYSRYRFAATLAKDIDSCVNILRYAGGSGSVPAGLKSENDYLVEANNIIKTIPVRVIVIRGKEFDKSDRIQNAFAATVGKVGFRTGDASSPYALQVTLALSEVNLANQANKFARYEIAAEMIDVRSRQGLLPTYSINGREGHQNYPEAQERAIRAAEAKINSEYKAELEEKLIQIK